MRALPFDGATHPFDGLDHGGIGDLQLLRRVWAGGVEGWGVAGVQPFYGRKRPMRERNLISVKQDQRGLAHRHNDIAPLRPGRGAPETLGL